MSGAPRTNPTYGTWWTIDPRKSNATRPTNGRPENRIFGRAYRCIANLSLDNMPRGIPIKATLSTAVLSCVLLLSAASAMAQANDPAPGPTAGAKIISKPDAQVPLDLQFRDESGQTVKLGDYFQPNRPVLLIMVYFGCPQLCSLSLNGVTKAVRKIDLQPGRQFEIVTVSFNPQEGPALAAAKKANYIKSLGNPEAAAGWHFLTNSDPSVAKTLGETIGFGFRLNPGTGQYLHEAGIYLCTPEGRVSRVEQGVEFDPEMLRDSLIHASQGKISSGLFGVALACGFAHFDMQTGKYTWAAMTIMRVTAMATLILLASGIGWMVCRENRKKTSPVVGDETERVSND